MQQALVTADSLGLAAAVAYVQLYVKLGLNYTLFACRNGWFGFVTFLSGTMMPATSVYLTTLLIHVRPKHRAWT